MIRFSMQSAYTKYLSSLCVYFLPAFPREQHNMLNASQGTNQDVS